MRKQPRAIELPQELRAEALVSLERYFNESFDERIGRICAGGRLNFFMEEVGPVIDNKAVAEAQERLAARVQEPDREVHEAEIPYWRNQGQPGTKARR